MTRLKIKWIVVMVMGVLILGSPVLYSTDDSTGADPIQRQGNTNGLVVEGKIPISRGTYDWIWIKGGELTIQKSTEGVTVKESLNFMGAKKFRWCAFSKFTRADHQWGEIFADDTGGVIQVF